MHALLFFFVVGIVVEYFVRVRCVVVAWLAIVYFVWLVCLGTFSCVCVCVCVCVVRVRVCVCTRVCVCAGCLVVCRGVSLSCACVCVCVCVCDFVIALVCLVWVCCLQVCLFGRCVFVFGGVGSVGWVGRVGRSVFFFGGVLGLVDGAPLVLPVRLCLRLSVGFVSQPLARAAARSVGRLVCLSV